MMLSLSNNIAEVMIALGITLIVIEVLVLGFSVFILFFIGLSLVITGAAIFFGILPDTLVSLLVSNAITTAILSALLWKPLKRLQSVSPEKSVTSDFHGHKFYLDKDIDTKTVCKYNYSGVMWTIKSNTPIKAGSHVYIDQVEVGVFWVKEVGQPNGNTVTK